MKVVIAAGGTAGHVTPGIALAHALPDAEVTFVGSTKGPESSLVPAAGFVLLSVGVGGFDRARRATLLSAGARSAAATFRLRRDLALISPVVVVGMGGYVSFPTCLAARSLGIPVVLHEQNIVLGLSNRMCKPIAKAIGVSFEETLRAAGRHAVLVGNPVRPEMVDFDQAMEKERGIKRFSLHPQRKTLLVFGGSQGAQRINEAAIGLASAWAERSDLQVLHIAGKDHAMPLRRRAAEASKEVSRGGLIYRVVDFVDRMVEAYAVADLAVSRGGATTIAELAVVGLPAIIVPYPYHRDHQQERQGRALQRAGGALIVPDSTTTPERLQQEVDRLLSEEFTLQQMRKAALAFGHPEASDKLAQVVRRCA
jgi:UDP-N-acetylglucosamine--N-acetylmuramyl-(pentapeptide) pyrophosphoryl-undecaprenol N-acetylglucosamine transferase